MGGRLPLNLCRARHHGTLSAKYIKDGIPAVSVNNNSQESHRAQKKIEKYQASSLPTLDPQPAHGARPAHLSVKEAKAPNGAIKDIKGTKASSVLVHHTSPKQAVPHSLWADKQRLASPS